MALDIKLIKLDCLDVKLEYLLPYHDNHMDHSCEFVFTNHCMFI